MSVATKNPFAILDAEDASRPSSPAPAPSKQASSPVAPSRGTQKSRGGPASRGGKYYPRGGAKSAPRDANQNQNGVEEPTTEPRKFEGGRGRGRGRGGERGGRGGRRPFDRHSQTGKTDSDKKIHQAWGGDDGREELKVEQAATVDAAAEGANWGGEGGQADWAIGETAPVDATSPAADEDKVENRPRKEKEEEEDNTLTLEQYLAKQREKEVVVPKLENTRKANEGADDDIWKGVVPLSKNEDEGTYFIGKTKSVPKARTKKEEKVYIEIDARFERPDRGGRGRGRGERGRGGRGRGSGRGGRQNGPPAPAVSMDDEVAFPSLS
ncbi:hypothetical protein AX17_000400 [Amanita inopinata Kibby_2008]|nr:hypothetical protein AX17_000400 [Amanita inopinata Kibby_2008]